MNSTIPIGWWWGGALLLTLCTRQVAFGFIPLAVHWQRRQMAQVSRTVHQQTKQLDYALAQLQQLQTQCAQVSDLVGPLGQQQQRIDHLLSQLQDMQNQLDQVVLQTRQQRAAILQEVHDAHDRLKRLELQTAPRVDALVAQLDQLQQQVHQLSQGLVVRQGVGVFIDGANLHESARRLGVALDYAKLLRRLVPSDVPATVHFYSGHYPHHPQQRQLHQELQQLGVQVHTKPVVRFADGGAKANMDGQMIVDMLTSLFTQVILLSGDGDFLPALHWLQQQGVQVEVAAFGPDTHHQLKSHFPFRDLRKLCPPGGSVVPLPAKQTAAVAG
ncbi:MAG: NYN domain-containing protein [Gloeomargarita sp. SKYBB_i_bin120]|nr:NYN domain-containing protein [Gloeomargarita sp. SKYB120]MDW8177583.1 NYN domain-containing protein [Gloeomargarita sp. SKYBB_i_bin120]